MALQPLAKIKYFNSEKNFGFVRTIRGDMFFKSQVPFEKGDKVFPVIQGANDKGLFGFVFTPEDINCLVPDWDKGAFFAVVLTSRGQQYVPIADHLKIENIFIEGLDHAQEGYKRYINVRVKGTINFCGREFTCLIAQPNSSEMYMFAGVRVGESIIKNEQQYDYFISAVKKALNKIGYDF